MRKRLENINKKKIIITGSVGVAFLLIFGIIVMINPNLRGLLGMAAPSNAPATVERNTIGTSIWLNGAQYWPSTFILNNGIGQVYSIDPDRRAETGDSGWYRFNSNAITQVHNNRDLLNEVMLFGFGHQPVYEPVQGGTRRSSNTWRICTQARIYQIMGHRVDLTAPTNCSDYFDSINSARESFHTPPRSALNGATLEVGTRKCFSDANNVIQFYGLDRISKDGVETWESIIHDFATGWWQDFQTGQFEGDPHEICLTPLQPGAYTFEISRTVDNNIATGDFNKGLELFQNGRVTEAGESFMSFIKPNRLRRDDRINFTAVERQAPANEERIEIAPSNDDVTTNNVNENQNVPQTRNDNNDVPARNDNDTNRATDSANRSVRVPQLRLNQLNAEGFIVGNNLAFGETWRNFNQRVTAMCPTNTIRTAIERQALRGNNWVHHATPVAYANGATRSRDILADGTHRVRARCMDRSGDWGTWSSWYQVRKGTENQR